MSVTFLHERSIYEERYDRHTVELCRAREEMMDKFFGERPPLNSHGKAESDNGYYQYSVMYFHLVEVLAGERWQARKETIEQWMADDDARDRHLADAQPAAIPYCRSCGEDMQITHKSYMHRKRGRRKMDEEDILFMFDCVPCGKRVASWQDSTEWKPRQTRCEKCGVPVDELHKRRGNALTTTYTCTGCGHHHKDTMRLGTSAVTRQTGDRDFKLDRRRFCFDAEVGKKFLERQKHIEGIRGLLAERQRKSGSAAIDPVAVAVAGIRRLKVARVAELLAKAVAEAGYIGFKLGELQVGPEITIPFSCLDNEPTRGDYDSRTKLKRHISTTLADTNWQLMSEGIRHHVGHLSGRLRGYESEEELRRLVERRLKTGSRKKPAAEVPVVQSSTEPESSPAPEKRTRQRKPRAIRVRGELHPELVMLIPARDTKRPGQARRRRNKAS
jgi:DNA-directed RNA polymerase subunit RPC12/RpoP